MTELFASPPIVSVVKAPATRRRTELLDAAATVFESAGIRASISDVAAECGVLAGSLYHHFDSKEAIVIELVERYVQDLERLAEAASLIVTDESAPHLQSVETLSVAIAECAVRHRAAVLLTFHDPPTSYGPELAELARRIPVAITAAMQALLDRAHSAGALRDDVDRALLADRLCQNMLHVAVGVFHRRPEAKDVPAIRCRMLLHGLAVHWPGGEHLDHSVARQTADAVIRAWPPPDVALARDSRILAAARTEFGRRGYEATTVRDVAAAAGVTTKAVYRLVSSKEELLWQILAPYAETLVQAWDAVLTCDATPLEKVDALLWLDLNVLCRYNEENLVMSVFMQFAPPTSADLDLADATKPADVDVPFARQLRKVRRLLADGERHGELRFPQASAEVRARCVFALLWTPHNIIEGAGPLKTLDFNRETLLRGAAAPH